MTAMTAMTYTGTDQYGRQTQGRTSTTGRHVDTPESLITRLSRDGWQQVTAMRDGEKVGEIRWNAGSRKHETWHAAA